jgi:hypothetical protein
MKNSFFKFLPIPICAVLAMFFTYFPITDTDIFWHLAAGREMVANRHFLFSDPFSFTLASPQWIDLHWLFQLLVYGLYMLGGLKAIIAFKLAAVAFVGVVLCLIFRSSRYIMVSAYLVSVLFYQARYLVLDRPVLITMVCMAVYLFLFENVRQGLNKQWLWLCIPLQIIWANSQGLYPIGIFIVGAYWIENLRKVTSLHFSDLSLAPPSPLSLSTPSGTSKGRPRERKRGVADRPGKKGEVNNFRENGSNKAFLTLLFFLCCLSCLVTPYGVSGILLPFKLFARIAPDVQNIYSLNISENVPLWSLTGFEAGYRTAVIVTALLACLLFVLNRKRTRIAHILLFAGFLALAVSAVRNVLLFFFVMIPVIASAVMNADVLFRLGSRSVWTRRALGTLCVSAGLGCLWTPIAGHWRVVSTYPPHHALSPFRFPEKITEYLKANPVQGEMFNDIRYGGYLIWELYPQKKVFIDGRLVIRSSRFFSEYLAICERPGLFPFVVQKFNITHVILPSAIFNRYLKLIKWLYASEDWHLEYTDGTSFLFVRNDARNNASIASSLNLSDSATVAAIADSIKSEWRDAPEVRNEALGYFSDVLEYLGLNRSAEMVEHK